MTEGSKPQTAMELALKAGDDAYLFATNEATALHDAFRAVISTYIDAAPVNASMGEEPVDARSAYVTEAKALLNEAETWAGNDHGDRAMRLLPGLVGDCEAWARTFQRIEQDAARPQSGYAAKQDAMAFYPPAINPTPRPTSELVAALRGFATAILHGDDEHRAWLLEAAECFIAGKSMPPPRGKGTSALTQTSGVAAPLPTAGVGVPTESGLPFPGDDLDQVLSVLETIEYLAHNDIKADGMKSIWDFARYAKAILPRIRSALTPVEGV